MATNRYWRNLYQGILWRRIALLVVAILAVPTVWFSHLFDPTDPNTRFYLLSTVAQTVGAMFGVACTAALVALQLAAQFYGPYAVRTVLRDRGVQGVAVLNVTTICLSLLLLANGQRAYLSSTIDESMVLMMAVASVCSVPYLAVKVLMTLRPIAIVDRLLEDLDIRHLARDIIALRADPFSPVMNVLMSCIDRKDFLSASSIIQTLISHVAENMKTLIYEAQHESKRSDYYGLLGDAQELVDRLCAHLAATLSQGTPGPFKNIEIRFEPIMDVVDQLAETLPNEYVDLHTPIVILVQALPKEYDHEAVLVLTHLGMRSVSTHNEPMLSRIRETVQKRGLVDRIIRYIRMHPTTPEGDQLILDLKKNPPSASGGPGL